MKISLPLPSAASRSNVEEPATIDYGNGKNGKGYDDDNDNDDTEKNAGFGLTVITTIERISNDSTPNNINGDVTTTVPSLLSQTTVLVQPSSTTSISSSSSVISVEARRAASALLLADDNSNSKNDFDTTEDDDVFADLRYSHKLPLGVPPPLDDDDNNDDKDGKIAFTARHNDNNRRQETQHSLPHVEELKAKNNNGSNSSGSKTHKLIFIGILSCILIFAVTFGFFFAVTEGARNDRNKTQNDDDDQLQQQLQTQQQNTYGNQKNSINEYRLRSLQDFFVRHGVTSEIHFDNSITMNSPQFQAVRWLANQDREYPSDQLIPILEEKNDLTTPEVYELVTRYIMAVFFYATSGKNWQNDLNFLSPSQSTCDWYAIFPPPVGQVGVLCNQNTKQILGLSLISNNVVGSFPQELSHLTTLTYLESIANSITGTIPNEWGALTKLRTLVMAFNELTGTIPSWVPKKLSNLEFLYLSNNMLTGTIPDEFIDIEKLSVLAIDDNGLTGSLDIILNLPTFEYLFLENNEFRGTLPSRITQSQPLLINLDVSSNRLGGSLPEDLFQLSQLEILDLHGNLFQSTIPQNIHPDNEQLKFIALHDNILEGTIPSTIANLRRLSHLDVTHNRLTGTLPLEMERCSDMTYLFVGANNFKKRQSIPSFIYSMDKLRELSLKGSNLKGTISNVIGVLEDLVVLDLDNNELTGSVPSEIGLLTNLQFLLLNRNQLSSSIPSQLENMNQLRFLLLDNNHLFGDLTATCTTLEETLNIVYVDCGEIICSEGCCSCCIDGQTCHDNNLISSIDPIWETEYKRQFFDFSGIGKDDEGYYSKDDAGHYSSNIHDDDFW